MNAVNVATAFHVLANRLSIANLQENPQFQLLLQAAGRHLSSIGCRELSTITHSTAKLDFNNRQFFKQLFGALFIRASQLDPQGVANCMWALGTMKKKGLFEDEDLAREARVAMKVLAKQAFNLCKRMKAQELANTCWGLSVWNHKEPELLRALAACVKALAFTPQGLSTVAYCFAKLKHWDEDLSQTLLIKANRVDGFDAQSLAKFLWTFSAMDSKQPELTKAVCAAALPKLGQFQVKGLVTLLWAVMQQSSELGAVVAQARDQCMERALELGESLDAQDLGLLASCLHRFRGSVSFCSVCRLQNLADQRCETMTWVSLAHVDLCLRTVSHSCKKRKFEAPESPLVDRLSQLLPEMASESDARNREPCALAKRDLSEYLSRDEQAQDTGKALLLVGDDPRSRLADLARSHGFTVSHWTRFSSEAALEDPSPSPWAPAGPFDCCWMRFPSSGLGAFEMTVSGVLSVLTGRTLVIYGCTDEGLSLSCMGLLENKFSCVVTSQTTVFSTTCCVIHATRLDTKQTKSKLAEWEVRQTVELPSCPPRPWLSYPGLFAGGGLDVMTACLLSAPDFVPPAKGRVLDFACGSGAIAAALTIRSPKLKLYLLDADVLALTAARSNVPTARAYFLSDCFQKGPRVLARESRSFEWIVSNPPVHRGQPDDFRVLEALTAGALGRLRPGGVLWLVAQEQIPVGCFLAKAGSQTRGYEQILALKAPGGRFVVWKAVTSR